MQKNKKKKRNLNIDYLLEEPMFYANGGPFDRRHNIQEFSDNPKHLLNESGENIFYDQSGGINYDNDFANEKRNYQDWKARLKFIEQHGMGVDEFYKTYPDQQTYEKEFPKFDAKQYGLGGGLWGNSNLNADPYAPIGQMANMAGNIGAGILDNAIEDQHQRINVEKETGMGILKGAGQGAALGANPLLAGATGGLSIAAGAAIGGITGGLISHKNAKKNAQANHDALIEQYYGDPNQTQSFADGGQMDNRKIVNDKAVNNKIKPDAQLGQPSGELEKEVKEEILKIPQSGVVVDKRTNTAYYYNEDGEVGSFNILSGENPEKNSNPYTVAELRKNKENRNTPRGGYLLETPPIYNNNILKTKMLKDDGSIGPEGSYYEYLMKHYDGQLRFMNPIKVDGMEKPTAKSIAFHTAYSNDRENPKDAEFNHRLNLLNQDDPNKRCASYGCINADDDNYTKLSSAFPKADTMMVIDSRLPSDFKLLEDAKKRTKELAMGGKLNDCDCNHNKYEDGGQMNNNPNQFGNQMSVFQGNKHEEGGIQLGMNSEVEAGEVKWKDYIFSDRLETEKGSTFASVAKRIKNKYKGREHDKLANDSMEIELTKLMKANESARLMKEEMNQASHLEDLKKYGGFVDLDGDGAIKYANGGRMEIARAARKAGLSPEKFAKHLINAKIKYADGGPFKFKYDNYDKPFPVDAGPFRESIGNYEGDSPIDFTNLGNYPMLNSDNIPSYNNFVVGNLDPNVYNIDGTAKAKSSTPNNSYGNITNYETPKFDPFVKGSEDNYFNMGTMEKITPKSIAQTKTSDQLPQRASYEPGSLDEFLSGYNNGSTTPTNPNNQRGSNNFGYAEAGLVASNLAGVDNFIKSLKPAQTKFDRINLDELDLSEARLMNARNQAQGLRQSQGNIRNNASSSGQALSNLAANNAALTEQKMNADLSTYLQENQTNVGIRNQEKSVNNQIGREEYIANEQNRANAQSVGNVALANIGNNTQGYFRDKVMTKADDQQNARMQEIINGMGFNYKWGTDPATDQYIIQFIQKTAGQNTNTQNIKID